MSEPVAIICRIRKSTRNKVDATFVNRTYEPEQMVELLPIGEKERGERPDDEMRAEELQERDPLYQEK